MAMSASIQQRRLQFQVGPSVCHLILCHVVGFTRFTVCCFFCVVGKQSSLYSFCLKFSKYVYQYKIKDGDMTTWIKQLSTYSCLSSLVEEENTQEFLKLFVVILLYNTGPFDFNYGFMLDWGQTRKDMIRNNLMIGSQGQHRLKTRRENLS